MTKKYRTVHLNVDLDVHQILKDEAQSKHIPIATLVREILSEYVSKNKGRN